MFVTYARTSEELRDEVCSDINRRISMLQSYTKILARSAAEKARIARAIVELEQMLVFWQTLTIAHSDKRRTKPTGEAVSE